MLSAISIPVIAGMIMSAKTKHISPLSCMNVSRPATPFSATTHLKLALVIATLQARKMIGSSSAQRTMSFPKVVPSERRSHTTHQGLGRRRPCRVGQLTPLIYAELRRLARHYRGGREFDRHVADDRSDGATTL